MRVLLTGITGFVGQNFLPLLLSTCPDIEVMTVNMNIQKANDKYPVSQYIHYTHIGVNELEKIVDFNPEIAIHLATLTTPRNDTEIISPLISANIELGVLLLDKLSKCPKFKLFVNTGTFAEFRFGNGKFAASSLYAASKTAFRSFLDYYSNLYRFKYLTAIPYSVYGGNMTVKRIMDYIKESMNSSTPIDMTNGEQILDFIHVDDIANFFVQVVVQCDHFYRLPNGEDFHLGTGRGTTIRELAELMEIKYKKKCDINWGGRPYRKGDIMHAVAPIAKNLSLIEWEAKISLKEGC